MLRSQDRGAIAITSGDSYGGISIGHERKQLLGVRNTPLGNGVQSPAGPENLGPVGLLYTEVNKWTSSAYLR